MSLFQTRQQKYDGMNVELHARQVELRSCVKRWSDLCGEDRRIINSSPEEELLTPKTNIK